MFRVTLALTLALVTLCAGKEKRFDGHQLLSFSVKSAYDVEFLKQLGEEYTQLDFWIDPAVGGVSNVVVPPSLQFMVKTLAAAEGIEYHVLNWDVQTLVDEGSKVDMKSRAANDDIIDHHNYHSYKQIQSFLNNLESVYPENVQVFRLRHLTHEGRDISYAIVDTPGVEKPVIVLEAGMHAREWISPAANLYFIEKLLKDYHLGHPTAVQMLSKYHWYLIPVANPDGYEYSRNTNRLWRKNRRYIRRDCSGVDLNRNFDSPDFGGVGVSHHCQKDTYCGPNAFSEPESSAVADLVRSIAHRLKAYVSIHAYSQLLLVPWCDVEYVSRPENAQELDRVGNLMVSALYGPYNTTYRLGTAFQLLGYGASGSSMDWVLWKYPGIYAYAYELRPSYTDCRGFILPPNEIIPQGKEYFDSLAVLAREMK